MKKLLLLLFIGSICYGQNPTRFMYGIAPANIVPYSPNAGVGINTTTPQAILDVVSTSSGILIPRMTTTQKNAIVTPVTSMLVYDSTLGAYYYYKSGVWNPLFDESNLVHKTGNETIAGIKTFTSKVVVDNVIEAPTQISFVTSGSTRMTADTGSISYFTDLRSNAPLYALNVLSVDGVSEFKQQMNLYTGKKLVGFSDFSTEKFRLDASNGTATFTGTVSGANATASNHFVTKGQSDVFVPLSGTTSGNPINGDLELDIPDDEITRYIKYSSPSKNGSISFNDQSININIENTVTSKEYALSVNGLGVLIGGDDESKGLSGESDFTPNITDLDYPQKIYVDNKTGWAVYQDTAYTIGSPFSILTGVTSTLPNNAGTVINTQIPTGITSFYDNATNKITPANNGDYYTTTIRFKATTTAPTAGYFDFGIDIGGALGVQFKETKIFAKGAGIEHNFSIVVPMYSGTTFIANGGLVKITSGNGNMSVYDINYHVDLVHKAK